MYKFILFFSILLYSHFALGYTQQGQLWFDASINSSIYDNSDIEYALEAQSQWADVDNHYKYTWLSGGLGYRQNPNLSFWAGYEWDGRDNIADTAPQNRLWQHMIGVVQWDYFAIRTRTRFEQTNRLHENEWDNRFREKVSFYFLKQFLFDWTPLIYDEFFIKLNNPSWNDSDTFEENRLFIGLDIPLIGDKQFLEVGYMQQYLFKENNTELNHIFYVGINFNPLSKSFPQYVK